jgi:hypothetical protein
VGAGCLAAARPRVDEEHRPLWRIRRLLCAWMPARGRGRLDGGTMKP